MRQMTVAAAVVLASLAGCGGDEYPGSSEHVWGPKIPLGELPGGPRGEEPIDEGVNRDPWLGGDPGLPGQPSQPSPEELDAAGAGGAGGAGGAHTGGCAGGGGEWA